MANPVITAALDLKSTFRCIGVRAPFTGDDNANATLALRYRRTGDIPWINAFTPIVDRRTTINGTANPYVREGRGSVVGLTPATSYDIEATWSDADGVTGTNPRTGTILTLSLTPTFGGTEKWVDPAAASGGDGSIGAPYNSIATAITNTVAGDTISLRAGTYTGPFTISASGTSGAYRRLRRHLTEVPTFTAASGDVLTLNANFWVIDGLHFSTSVGSCFVVGSAQHHLYIQNCDCSDIGTNGAIGNAFVQINSGANNIYVLTNSATRVTTAGLLSTQENDGVYFISSTSHTCVIDGNTFTGKFWDGIGNQANNQLTTNENCDYSNNTINGYADDSIEMDGGSVNLRCWGNIVITAPTGLGGGANGNSVVSEAGTIAGPSYIFRNVFSAGSGWTGSGVKQGNDGVGYCFFFHNTVETNGTGGNEALGEAGGPSNSLLHTYWNNILKSTGNTITSGGRTNLYDYNLSFITNGANYAEGYSVAPGTFATLAAFQATGQEAHGISGNPLLDAQKHIPANSPAVDAGVLIANFNTLDSFWPYGGTAPDLGAFEVGAPVPAAEPVRAGVGLGADIIF